MNAPRIAGLAVVIVGALLRLYQLTLRPFHHDEGVNGWFMIRLVNEGVYKYDPQNYHGPSLYYLVLPLIKVFGFHTSTLRLLPVLFGVGVLVLVLLLGRRLGTWAAVAAAALLAVSPGMVFISRYFIHEMMVLFFTLGIVVAVDAYNEKKTILRLFLASASMGFLFATKETAAPTVVVLIIAWGMGWGWMKLGRKAPASAAGGRRKGRKEAPPEEPSAAPSVPDDPPHRNVAILMWALVVFVAINALLYSSFYTNRQGLLDALRSLAFWSKTGETAHVHDRIQYVKWMWSQEAGVLLLGFAGIALALWRRPNTLVTTCAFWALGILSMYSLIKYKTPWLTINIVMPFGIMGGYAIQEIGRLVNRWVAIGVLCAALAWGGYQAVQLNLVHYDDNTDEYVYVYAHTWRDINRLLADIDATASRLQGLQTRIPVVAPAYWPLPWYMREYKNAQFFGHMTPLNDATMVIARDSQEAEVRTSSQGQLQVVGTYQLRPGETLQLWARASAATPPAAPKVSP